MESLKKEHNLLRDKLNKELDNFEVQLHQELASKANSFATEKQEYLQEIDALRLNGRKLERLEADNKALRAELETARAKNQQQSTTIEVEEYDRVVHALETLKQSYGRALGARKFLESRCRRYKEIQQEWREYCNELIKRHAKTRTRSSEWALDMSVPPFAADDHQSSSASAPPAFLADLTPVTFKDASRSTPPRQEASSREHSIAQQALNTIMKQDGKLDNLKDKIIVTQSAVDDRHQAEFSDLGETQDDSGASLKSLRLPKEPNRVSLLDVDDRAEKSLGKLTGSELENASAGDNQVLKPTESGDDDPIIVTERPVKKRRLNPKNEQAIHVQVDYPAHVKNEQASSSPLPVTSSHHPIGTHGSLDLDDVGNTLDTPRKRHRFEQMRLRSSVPAKVHSCDIVQHSSAIDLQLATLGQSASELKVQQGNNAVNSRLHLTKVEKEKQARVNTLRAASRAHNDRVHGPGDESGYLEQTPLSAKLPTSTSSSSGNDHKRTSPAGRLTTGESTLAQYINHMPARGRVSASPAVLRPVDGNVPILPRTTKKGTNLNKPSSRRDRGVAYLHALAEDGDVPPPVVGAPVSARGLAKSTSRATANVPATENESNVLSPRHRLGNMLNNPSPERVPLPTDISNIIRTHGTLQTPAAATKQFLRQKPPFTPSNIPSRSPKAGDVTGSESAQFANKNPTHKPSTLTSYFKKTPQQHSPKLKPQPLRSLPLQRLTLHSFKPNRAHHEYFPNEILRKHDEKKAVAGCVDPNCVRCKDMRKFIIHSSYALPDTPQAADELLLDKYLDGDKKRLGRMTKEEKDELLVKVRVKLFADEHGKHRQPRRREQSPVDYWNVEMQTTQEEERNREETREREREKVEERYWEAMSRDGRFMFADE